MLLESLVVENTRSGMLVQIPHISSQHNITSSSLTYHVRADIGDVGSTKASSADDAWRDHRARNMSKSIRGSRRRRKKRVAPEDLALLPPAEVHGAILVDENLMSLWISGLLSLSLAVNNSYTNLRVAKFAYGYFGKNAEASSGLMTTLNFWRSPQFYAMKAAGNALGLLYLATWLPHPQVFLEARKAHVTAANRLRKEVEKPCVNFMAVLGAAEALISCEAYSLVSSGPVVTTTHLSGIMDVLRSTTHQAATATIRNFLFRKFRHLSLMQSLVCRRALAGEHIWWLCSTVQPSSDVETLMRLAVRLPPLLETAEIVRHSCDPDERVMKGLRSRLLRLEADFAEWLSEFESTAAQTAMEDAQVDEADVEIGVYWLRTRPVVAVPALRFTSFLDATCHALYWICSLLLRQALIPLTKPPNGHHLEH